MDIKQMLQDEAEKLRARLKEIEGALEGLERAEEVASKLIEGRSRNGGSGRGSLKDALLRLIADKKDTFSAPELWREVREAFPDGFGDVHKASVSAAVKDLAERSEIKMLREGAGSRAAVYAKLDYQEGGKESEEVGLDSPEEKSGAAGD